MIQCFVNFGGQLLYHSWSQVQFAAEIKQGSTVCKWSMNLCSS
jgi:hypothetical protein